MAVAGLLNDFLYLFRNALIEGPVLDLACGDGQNGLAVAALGYQVIGMDVSPRALDRARKAAAEAEIRAEYLQTDLEAEGVNPLPEDAYGAVLVFRYLHRPLMPCIRKALKPGGVLIYETFTTEQRRYGKPKNPDFLLRPGELRAWFADWEILHDFEGILPDPERAAAQLVARKP